MAISKIILNGVTQMDATPATAGAADITAPKTAMLADGVLTTGTGSGGGSSDFSTADITIINNSSVHDVGFYGANAVEYDGYKYAEWTMGAGVLRKLILYGGHGYFTVFGASSVTASWTGEVEQDGAEFWVYSDATITITDITRL